MKIVFSTPNLEVHGGNLVMLKYAQSLCAAGHQIAIVAGKSKERIKTDRKIKLLEVALSRIPYLDFSTFFLFALFKFIRKIPKDADIIIPIYFPLVVHAIFAKKLNKMDKAKIIPLFQDFRQMFWTGRYIFWLLRQGFIRKEIDKIIAVSTPIAEEIERYSGLKLIVVLNAIEHGYFYPRNLTKENYILFIGRTNISKGFPYFLKAMKKVWKKYPKIKAKVVTPEKVQKKEPRMEFIQYEGNREKLARIYNKALIYVNTSSGESFGLPALEAMASGTAVVLTDTIGSREYAKNNQNCLVVPIKNLGAIAKAIIRLLEDENLRKKIEINGLKTASKYRWEDSIAKFRKVIESLR